MKYFYLALMSFLLITACNNGKKQEPAETQHNNMNMQMQSSQEMFENPSSNITLDNNILKFENIKMQIPDNWEQVKPSSSMRIIQFVSKNNSGLVVAGFYFGNRENMTEANISRWKSQFVDINSVNTKEFAGGKAMLVEIEGTYKKRPSEMTADFTAAPNYKTLAAIVSTPQGPYFFKMVGPAKEVNKELPNFEKFLNSYTTK